MRFLRFAGKAKFFCQVKVTCASLSENDTRMEHSSYRYHKLLISHLGFGPEKSQNTARRKVALLLRCSVSDVLEGKPNRCWAVERVGRDTREGGPSLLSLPTASQ